MSGDFYTAIQLRSDVITSSIAYGDIQKKVKSDNGYAAIIEGNKLIYYIVRHQRTISGYLFNTSEYGNDIVTGVYPAVSLYCHVRGFRKVGRIVRLIDFYLQNKECISNPDCFFTRSVVLVNQLKFENKDLRNLFLRCKK